MMDASSRKPWVRAVIFTGVVYVVVGYGSAALDPSVPDRARFGWRLAAWAVSVAVFAAHIGYEHFRLGDSPRALALHSAAAVALGAFMLAAAAMVHAATAASHAPYWQFLLALVLWPIITALPELKFSNGKWVLWAIGPPLSRKTFGKSCQSSLARLQLTERP